MVTIEIEPEMIRASRTFYPANRRVFDDSRSSFALDDARAYFAARGEQYDLILSEPSNPWVAGVSGLFTTEFYSHVRRFMTPRGVFGQWLHVSEMHDGLVLSVVRAVADNFSDYALYSVSNHDILIVATNQGALPRPDWSVLGRAGIAEDLRRVLPLTRPMLDALRIADATTLAPLVRGGGGNSDFYPTLDLGAERSRYLKEEATGFVALSGDRFGIARLLESHRAGVSVDTYTVVGGVHRLEAMELAARMRQSRFVGADAQKLLAVERARSVDRMLASDQPPVDWHVWVESVRDAEETRAGGSAGVADTAFFLRAERYLARQAAPERARAAVRFLHGLAGHDFAGAAQAADTLLVAAASGDLWLPPELLGEGAVIAYLRTGNVAGATAALGLVEHSPRRAPPDARPQLLAAWVRAAEAAQRAPTAASR